MNKQKMLDIVGTDPLATSGDLSSVSQSMPFKVMNVAQESPDIYTVTARLHVPKYGDPPDPEKPLEEVQELLYHLNFEDVTPDKKTTEVVRNNLEQTEYPDVPTSGIAKHGIFESQVFMNVYNDYDHNVFMTHFPEFIGDITFEFDIVPWGANWKSILPADGDSHPLCWLMLNTGEASKVELTISEDNIQILVSDDEGAAAEESVFKFSKTFQQEYGEYSRVQLIWEGSYCHLYVNGDGLGYWYSPRKPLSGGFNLQGGTQAIDDVRVWQGIRVSNSGRPRNEVLAKLYNYKPIEGVPEWYQSDGFNIGSQTADIIYNKPMKPFYPDGYMEPIQGIRPNHTGLNVYMLPKIEITQPWWAARVEILPTDTGAENIPFTLTTRGGVNRDYNLELSLMYNLNVINVNTGVDYTGKLEKYQPVMMLKIMGTSTKVHTAVPPHLIQENSFHELVLTQDRKNVYVVLDGVTILSLTVADANLSFLVVYPKKDLFSSLVSVECVIGVTNSVALRHAYLSGRPACDARIEGDRRTPILLEKPLVQRLGDGKVYKVYDQGGSPLRSIYSGYGDRMKPTYDPILWDIGGGNLDIIPESGQDLPICEKNTLTYWEFIALKRAFNLDFTFQLSPNIGSNFVVEMLGNNYVMEFKVTRTGTSAADFYFRLQDAPYGGSKVTLYETTRGFTLNNGSEFVRISCAESNAAVSIPQAGISYTPPNKEYGFFGIKDTFNKAMNIRSNAPKENPSYLKKIVFDVKSNL